MKQGLRAHEFNLTTGDNTTQPQSRPPGGTGTGVPAGVGGDHAHHRSRHHGSHHGHHHSRANSSSSSTSTATAPVVNNAHGHHMPTSSTKHLQHPNSASSNKQIDQRHHRQDREFIFCFHGKKSGIIYKVETKKNS